MSSETTADSEDIEADFEPARGSVPQEIDMADEGHDVREALGESAHRELEAHEGTLGERFAFRYGKAIEFLREYLANAETGCIRACKHKLREHDSDTYDNEWFADHTVPELIEEAKEVTGYRPIIETHASPQGASMDRFRIEDNGIGISIEEFVALKKLGLSASHDEGGQLGSFGQGVMSKFNATGEYGEATVETWSRIDGANYRERFRITGFNDLPGQRDSPGTTWKFPAFSEEAEPIDIEDGLEAYTTGMFVPVLHHEYDEGGTEIAKEEYTPQSLAEALLDEDDPRFVYEDDHLEVVMSPAISSDDQEVFLVSMPIESGCDLSSFEAPYPFHVRFKHEDGRIYRSTRDCSDEGLIPVTEARFENELVDAKGAVTTDHLVPGDLVGYEHDDYDQIQVPPGVDDDLVSGLDNATINDDLDGYGTDIDFDSEFDPIIAEGPNGGKDVLPYGVWESIETDVESTYIPYNQIIEPDVDNMFDGNELADDIDIVSPQPVDDRGRLEENNGELFRASSLFVKKEFISQAADLFEALADNGFDHFFELDDEAVRTVMMAFQKYISWGRNEISDQVVRKQIDETFDVTVSNKLANQLTRLSETVEHAPRHVSSPERRYNRDERSVASIMQEAGADGTVYMASSVHAEKARLAWGVHENNHVVGVDNASMYDAYSELLGWVPLKELDLRGIKDKYDIEDDLAESLERDPVEHNSTHDGYSMDDLDAETREIKIRTKKERTYHSTTPKEVKNKFSNGKAIQEGGNICRYLLVFKENEVSGIQTGHEVCKGSVSRTIVPEYVAEYLEDIPRCYVCEKTDYTDEINEIIDQMEQRVASMVDISEVVEAEQQDESLELELSVNYEKKDEITVTDRHIGDLGTEAYVVTLPNKIQELLDGDVGIDEKQIYARITESLIENDIITTSVETLVLATPDFLFDTHYVWDPVEFYNPSPTVIFHKKTSKYRKLDYERWEPDNSLKVEFLLPPDRFDRDSPEWENLVDYHSRNIERDNRKGEALVDILHRLAEYVPDDEPVFPSNAE